MNKSPLPLRFLSIFLFIQFFQLQNTYSQTKITGKWEGVFMNDFQTFIEFRFNEENQFVGRIKMMAGNNLIQDDPLSDIKTSEFELSFKIPDKNTTFQGQFNSEQTELEGAFIFPDNTRHQIHLTKSRSKDSLSAEYKSIKSKKIGPKDLEADLSFLYSKLQQYHPQLYQYTSKDSMDYVFKHINNQLTDSLTIEDFFVKANALTNAVKCSHTGLRLPPSYTALSDRFANYFPFRLFFENNKAYYASSIPELERQLQTGTEITQINNLSIDEIIQKLIVLIPSEGCNTTTQYNQLNKHFNELYSLIDHADSFEVFYLNDKKSNVINIPSCSKKSITWLMENSVPSVSFSFWDGSSIGLLKLPSFAIANMEQYLGQLDSIFNILKTANTTHLILDLRDNSGGHPIFAAQLFSYLTKNDFTYFKRNEDVPDFEPLYNIMHTNKLSYHGTLYVLVNGGCLSTTGHLISLLKYNTNAVFIGEQPGSTYRCNDYSIQFQLPTTKIEVNTPRTTFETSVSGFFLCDPFPIDYSINNSINNILEGKDPYIETVKSIVIK